MTISRPSRSARRAFTLAELVAVLAVLAILAGLAWPRLLGVLTRSELVESGKRTRAALVQARLRAIESGQPWVFRFTPGTGRYEVLPAHEASAGGLFPPGLSAEQLEDGSTGRTILQGSTGRRFRLPTALRETLPGGVAFEKPADLSFLDPDVPAETETLASQAATEPNCDVKVVFQANGRAPDARIVLVGSDGRRLELAFRGLTGTATLGRPFRKPLGTLPEEERPAPSEAGRRQRSPDEAAGPAASTESEDTSSSDLAGEGQP